MPHLNRTQAFVEKNESGTGVLPIVTRVCKPPHSELVARGMNIEIFCRYAVIVLHSVYDAPSIDLCRHKPENYFVIILGILVHFSSF